VSTPQPLSRAHLEALALAYVLQDPGVAEALEFQRLSPSAAALIAFAADENTLARAAIGLVVSDAFRARLAKRAFALTIEELLFFPRDTVVALVNALPVVGAERARSAA
jgi:hypothetical protein